MYYYPYNWCNHYLSLRSRNLNDYYAMPSYGFDPYKLEPPKFHSVHNKWQHCKNQCIAAGFIPGTLPWSYCMKGCQSLLGSLLEDPTFLEDMMEE